MWPLAAYEVPQWLGVPCRLSSAALYGKGILKLPISGLKSLCAKASLEVASTKSKDPVVKSVAPIDNSEEVEGKIGCTARTGSSEAYRCPGLRSAWAWWLRVGHWEIHVASVVEKRKMEVEKNT